ncbi:Hypothetical protein NCS54_00523600 [Fusarium falciforme]|uniref:Hypothetical protein n=1 Tax=Fusarium falciforme TaxID=195108 RepID=UPI0023013A8B|nr:Hypothetical protein NCS54_00523600 [Fusarium falciforme]WAO87913.1 Hypothetical protein NCS54_00523600 [Fusarium falciforme]
MASTQAPSKRPRLSLQIKTSCSPATRSSRSYAVDPKDPTAFNTLSNVYVTTIERSTPVQTEPMTAINTLEAFSLTTPMDAKHRVVTPYVASYPETPLSENAPSPNRLEINYPSTMTATPPLSAGPVDSHTSKPFSFSAADTLAANGQEVTSRSETLTPPRSQSLADVALQAPYTHPRSLHSILRNSPLPPPTAIPPFSPRRQSRRLQEKANRRVGYSKPLTQEIVTNKYTKSHIDLLVEEASPHSPPYLPPLPQNAVDLAMAFTPNEIQDGGQTPGPFTDTTRRMGMLTTGASPSPQGTSPAGPKGVLKRKRKEKKRRWVWTIGQDEEDDENVGGSIAALRAEAAKPKTAEDVKTPLTAIKIPQITYSTMPTPSIESADSESESFDHDVEMSDTSSCLSVPDEYDGNMDVDLKTPTAPKKQLNNVNNKRDTPVPADLLNVEGGRDDTPIPAELLNPSGKRDTPIPSDLLSLDGKRDDTPIPSELLDADIASGLGLVRQ